MNRLTPVPKAMKISIEPDKEVLCRDVQNVAARSSGRESALISFRPLTADHPPLDTDSELDFNLDLQSGPNQTFRLKIKPNLNRFKPKKNATRNTSRQPSRLCPFQDSNARLCQPMPAFSRKKSPALIKPKILNLLGKSAKKHLDKYLKKTANLCANQTSCNVLAATLNPQLTQLSTVAAAPVAIGRWRCHRRPMAEKLLLLAMLGFAATFVEP